MRAGFMINIERIKFLCLLLLLSCYYAQPSIAEEYVPSVDVKKVTVNGIRLDSRENEIYGKLGKPEKVVGHGVDEVVGGKAKTIYYPGLKIYLIDGEIFNLECTGKSCVTGKGIRVGDDRKKVERAYGAPSQYEKTGNRLGYVFRLNGNYIDSSLVFFSEMNKVEKVIYFVDYT